MDDRERLRAYLARFVEAMNAMRMDGPEFRRSYVHHSAPRPFILPGDPEPGHLEEVGRHAGSSAWRVCDARGKHVATLRCSAAGIWSVEVA